MSTYPKLVRDRIPDILREKGFDPKIHVASSQEFRERLFDKMGEEINEYKEDPSINELVDIGEFLYALCGLNYITIEELLKYMDKKRKDRGGFSQAKVLEEEAK